MNKSLGISIIVFMIVINIFPLVLFQAASSSSSSQSSPLQPPPSSSPWEPNHMTSSLPPVHHGSLIDYEGNTQPISIEPFHDDHIIYNKNKNNNNKNNNNFVEEQRTRFSGFKKMRDVLQDSPKTIRQSSPDFQLYMLFHSVVLLSATSVITLSLVMLVAGLRKIIIRRKKRMQNNNYNQIESISSTLDKQSACSYQDRNLYIEEFDII